MLQNVINGKTVAAADGHAAPVINAATGEAFTEAPVSREKDIDAAFQAASSAFGSWRDTTPSQRQDYILKLGAAVRERLHEFSEAEVENVGKPRELMRTIEAPLSLDLFNFWAGAARMLEGRAATEYTARHTSMIRREPVGPVGVILPWNYPMAMAIAKTCAAIAMGNTVVLKPADDTPVTALLYGQIAADILPPGVVNVVAGDRETGRLLVDHPIPKLINFTGSERGGREVATSAAKNLKRCILELGGNAPVVVFESADLEAAVQGIMMSTYVNAGQDCTAAHRVLVHDSVYEKFSEMLAAASRQVLTGAPDDEGIFYGPIINEAQWSRIKGVFDRLPQSARILTGGEAYKKSGGHYVSPTVINNVGQQDEVVQCEIFGPVITVQPFSTEEEALRLANGVPFGLASSVWTGNHGQALRVSRELEFGIVFVNADHHVVCPDMPHGGFNGSGYGKDLSVYCAEEMTRIKQVTSGWI